MTTNVFKKYNPYISWIKTFFKSLFISLAVTFAVSLMTGYQYFNVISNSMSPTMPINTVVCVYKNVKFEDLKVGDVITYGESLRVTHRIVDINMEKRQAGTLGDKEKIDGVTTPTAWIDEDSIVGKVVFYVPHLGSVVNWLKDPIALVFIVIAIFLSFFVTMYV